MNHPSTQQTRNSLAEQGFGSFRLEPWADFPCSGRRPRWHDGATDGRREPPAKLSDMYSGEGCRRFFEETRRGEVALVRWAADFAGADYGLREHLSCHEQGQ